MKMKQISVFVENKKGRLAAILDVLGRKHINIRALSVADTTDFGILRMIVDAPEEAKLVLREEGVIARTNEVLAVPVPDKPGALVHILEALSENDVSVEYMYAYTAREEGLALMVFRVDDPEKAERIVTNL